MTAKKWVLAIWLIVLATAGVIIWQMQAENGAQDGQSTHSSNGVVEQPSATPLPETEGNPVPVDTAFIEQVLRFYEISNTENRNKQNELLPTVATKHFLESYRWNFRNDSDTITTSVDSERSRVEMEESTTDKNVRYVTTRAYVIKDDSTSDEHYEEQYPPDHTTWINEADGIWRIHGQTVSQDTTAHS
ncbi:MAG: hypothetical protein JWM07_767 [Candidatus Saccharibacteria bacterium]|nr:hypothetical protein [Candidatus Saccharibacteria bacterium]